jgi:NHLM bacteriocin system ABC transporter ATP-binding protein
MSQSIPASPTDVPPSSSETDARILDRIDRSEVETRQSLRRSLRQLEAVDAGRYDVGSSAEWGNAARAVFKLLPVDGTADHARKVGLEGDRLTDVPAACRVLGAGCRLLFLPDLWWQRDQGPLVGTFLGEGDEDQDTVVALAPRTIGGYIAFNPTTNESHPVTKEIAARIAPSAYAIYPALPAKVSGLVDLARFLWPSLRRDLWRLLVASGLIGLVGLLIPIATGLVIDQLIPSGELSLLYQFGMGLLAASLMTAAFTFFQKMALLRLGGRSALTLRAAVWNRVLRFPATFFKQFSSGDLSQRIGGIEAMRSVVMSVMLSATITVFFAGLYLALLFYYDRLLALVALGIVIVLAALTLVAGLVQLKYQKRQAILSGWLSGYVFQVLQAIIKLRVAGAEERAFARWAKKYADKRAAVLASRRISDHLSAFTDAYLLLSLALLYGMLGFGGRVDLSAGTFIAFMAAYGVFQGAFMGLSGAVLQIVTVAPHYERARPILEAEPEQSEAAADPGPLSGAIEISKLCFAYAQGGTPVLKDVSLTIKPGEHVAIVGPSGSGKSTLIRLLLVLERPLSGTVLYDGQDLSGLDLAAVRRQIGVVLQTGRVFAGTIIENVRGASNASLENCMAACEAAGFADDLATLPMGPYTPLTEGAPTLSGGQRQRILIARALISNPKILLMDEATSALDNRSQALVTDSLNRLAVTRVVIAHRLSTVRNADTIVVIDRGEIVEKGNYEELMSAGGLFTELASRQLT